MAIANQSEFFRLRELSARVGRDPLLTQASTGNSSIKLDGQLWIKSSGRWMADAGRDDIFVPLRLDDVRSCLLRNVDPAAVFPDTSVETAMHAALPHKTAVHLHSVDSIAWAVRQDAVAVLTPRLEGISWHWIPYTPSGLPLAQKIERAADPSKDADVFILGNHGLLVAASTVDHLEKILDTVLRRLVIHPRYTHPADYSILAALAEDSGWDIPDDDDLHALATDPASQSLVNSGVLFPCQTFCARPETPSQFRPVSANSVHESQYARRPFIIVEQCGVLVNRRIGSAELAMLSGLVQVLRRLDRFAPVRYLTEEEIAGVTGQAGRYTTLANLRRVQSPAMAVAP